MSASPDINAVTDTLISHYNDWKETLPQPAASDLPAVQSADIDVDLQPSAPEHNKPTILHDATISETPLLPTLPATNHHPPQHEVTAEDSLLQAIADNQSSAHEDILYEPSTTDKDYPSQHEENPVIEKSETTTDDHSLAQQHDSLVAESPPVLQSIADIHTQMEKDPPQHEDDTAIEEAEPVIDDHPPQQHDGLVVQPLPVLQSIADGQTVTKKDPLAEAPLVQSTPDDSLHLPLQENQPAQEQQEKDDIYYSLQELVSSLKEYWDILLLKF